MKLTHTLLFISLLVGSVHCQAQEKTQKTEFHTEEREVIIAREYCLDTNFSMCAMGWRVTPFMLNFKTKNIAACYLDTLFVLMPYFMEDTSQHLVIDLVNFSMLNDTLDAMITDKAFLYRFMVKNRYKKKIRSYMKRSRLNINFDGFLYYAIYKLRVEYLVGHQQEVILPDLDLHEASKDALIISETRNINFITAIKSIELIPYCKNK